MLLSHKRPGCHFHFPEPKAKTSACVKTQGLCGPWNPAGCLPDVQHCLKPYPCPCPCPYVLTVPHTALLSKEDNVRPQERKQQLLL
jgi:hypothetical protein